MFKGLFSVVLFSVLFTSARAQDPAAPLSSGFGGYSEAPPFEVVERPWPPVAMPCPACHQIKPTDPTPRVLPPPHPQQNHGDGRFWCLTCHNPDQRDKLLDLSGNEVSVQEVHLVCGQCHFDRQRDWTFGVHGKRVGNWRGERRIFACTHCHDAHDPAIAPRKPQPPPPLRVGLTREPGERHAALPIWQKTGKTVSPEVPDE